MPSGLSLHSAVEYAMYELRTGALTKKDGTRIARKGGIISALTG